ncbi:class I adenylate-forming enzyme family protein [Zhongshania sp.]|uniref:class I adenylate-forming enzyme family protein n=1 Tax=Zhongshania sp. TaxID=1971902 RepID=UPI002A833EEB|nr:class I adenylate-forming enzyme family protein [Zhongshania sp.]
MSDIESRRQKLRERFPAWEFSTIASLMDCAASEFGDRPLVLGVNFTMTYGQAVARSRDIAKGMLACGIKKGDHVALVMANFPEFIPIKAAIARIGAVAVPINYMLRENELKYVLLQSDSKMLICMDQFSERNYSDDVARILKNFRQGYDSKSHAELKEVFLYETGNERCKSDFDYIDKLIACGIEVTDAELEKVESQTSGEDLSDIVYTSGTTGKPKGVMISHQMVLRAAYASALVRAFEDGRRIQFALPMYHVFGYVECWIACMYVGGAIIPHVSFDPLQMIETAEACGTTEMVCVPLMTEKILEVLTNRRFNAPKFIAMFNSGGVCRPCIWDDIQELMGAKEMLTAYGMSETTASTTCTLPEGPREYLTSSNGCLKMAGIAGTEAAGEYLAIYKTIDPETGKDLPPGVAGELLVKGPIVTKGYYRKPMENKKAINIDGWLHTGDIGIINSDGYLSLTGRLKETYRCGGEMVMPKEIEAILDDYPGVKQVFAVGLPDTKMGEVGCLCVVTETDVTPDKNGIIEFCKRELARFKVPKYVVFMEEKDIPMTATGRPQKFKLAEIAEQILSAEAG